MRFLSNAHTHSTFCDGKNSPEEMIRAAEALYGKYVPANVREFIDLRAGQPKAPVKKKPPRPSSAVGAADREVKQNV